MSEADGLVVGGQVFRLPGGTRVAAAPLPRPLPAAPPGLLGVVAVGGQVLPVWARDPLPRAWVELAGGLMGGTAFRPAPPGAPLLRLPDPVPSPRPEPTPLAPAPSAPPAPVPPATVVLRLAGGTLGVPIAALLGIRPWPDAVSPPLGRAEGVLGYAATMDGPLLLLNEVWCFGEVPREGDEAPLQVAALQHRGRRLGVPCGSVALGASAAPLLPRLDGSAAGRRILALAPRPAEAEPDRTAPRRALMLCRAGETRFLLPARSVEALIPPQAPLPLPGPTAGPGAGTPGGLAGVCAHRGDVLPVIDAARRLGTGALPAAPSLLRLAGPPPFALAVTEVLSLREVEEAAIVPLISDSLASDPLVEALALADDGPPLPLLRVSALMESP